MVPIEGQKEYYIFTPDKMEILERNSISTKNSIEKKFNFSQTCLKLNFLPVPGDSIFTGIKFFLVISSLKETSNIALLTASKSSLKGKPYFLCLLFLLIHLTLPGLHINYPYSKRNNGKVSGLVIGCFFI